MDQDTTKVIRIVIDSSRAVDGSAQATRALKAIEDQTKKTGDTLSQLQSAFESVTKLTLFGYGIKEVTGTLLEMWSKARDAAVAIQDLSEQLGVNVKFVQASQFAAASNTVSLEQMGTGFTKASKLIGEATQGNKAAIDTLNAMGVKILDAGGKLRSTEAILSDSAAAILKIEDPAKRVALAMQLFGKTGAELIPMLKDLAMGQDVMATKAQQAGAMIESGVLKQLADLKAHSEEASLKWNALVANIGAPIATAAMEAVNNILATILANIDRLKNIRLSGSPAQLGANVAGALLDPGDLGRARMAYDAQSSKIAGLNTALADPAISAGQRALYQRQLAREQAALPAFAAPLQQAQQVQYGVDENSARAGSLSWEQGYTVNPAEGASNPTSTDAAKAAESLTEKINKLRDTLTAAANAQDAMTAEAEKGDVAFQQQQAHSEALSKAIEAYGGKVSATSPQVQALASDIEKLILRTKEGAAAQAFVVGTTELQKQNDLLTAQIALMNEAPDIQAKEIALIKSQQEAQKAGNKLTDDQIEARRQAIEQNEKLKTQQEQLKQAQELWTEPLKQALRDIQTAGANAFDQLLESGNFSFQSLAQTFTTTLRKMAAEFLALATIRPVLSFAVSGLTSAGIITPSMANAVGFPQTVSGSPVAGVGAGGGGGGLGLGSIGLPSGGGGSNGLLGGMLGSGFMNTPIFGGGIDSEIANWSTYGTSGAAGFGGMGQGLLSANATWGQALGGIASIAGIGMGAMQLANAKGAGGIIGGASGIIGGGLGLAAAIMPALAGTLGPIGLAVGIGGTLLGSLLGNGGPEIPPMPGLGYQQGTVMFGMGGAPIASGDMASGANSIGQSVLSLISATGGTGIAGKLYGGTFSGGTTHTWDGKQWVGQDYTQANITSPTGATSFIGGTGQGVSPQAAAEALTAQIFRSDVLTGAIKGVSDSLVKVFTNLNTYTVQATQDAITFANAYDKLGKAADPVKDAIDKLDQQFATLSQQATTYGLSLDPINAELAKETKRTAQDFIDNMLDPLSVQMRALDDAQQSALASAKYINDNIEGVFADTNKIVDYYNKQRLALEDQFYQGAITNLQNLINRLTYGDLANASPSTMLTGTSASYTAALAQARAGDATAITNLPTLAESYATTARSYFASSPQYAALVDQIRQDLGGVVAVASGGASAAGTPADPQQINAAVQVQMAANDQLREVVQQQSDQIDKLMNMVSSLTAQLRSAAVNGM